MPKASTPVWMNPAKQAPDALVLAFCAGRDTRAVPPADETLIPYDLWTNRAHVTMLRKTGIISSAAAARILGALTQLEQRWRAGKWTLDPALEDVHANIEAWVSAAIGPELGGLIHTARSRNDQVNTDMRLWLRDTALEQTTALAALVETLLALAAAERETVMPGLTHHQPGCVTTLGHWQLCHAAAFTRDLARLRNAYELLNRCPLGATASFGTSWPIDRALTARLLGFAAPQINSLDAVASRWEMEAELGHALATMMVHASMLAQDWIVFSSEPFGFVVLDERHTTGSSVMPQKRNPDPCEVVKAKAALAQQLQQALRAVPTGNLTGYNRDSQWTKYIILDLARECADTPAVLALLAQGARWRRDRMAAAARRGFLEALDVADYLGREFGLPFRQAYRAVSLAVTALRAEGGERLTAAALNAALAAEGVAARVDQAALERVCDPVRAVKARRSMGSPAPKETDRTARLLASEAAETRGWAEAEKRRLARCRAACV